MTKQFFLLAGMAFLISQCTYNNEEELYPDENDCDTTEVSYSSDVQPILENNCYRCHDAKNNEANITLEGYANVRIYVDNGRLLGAVRHDPGFVPMPHDAGMLNDCNIAKIETWIDEGALDN